MTWHTARLGEVCSLIARGIAPKYADEGLAVINQKCVRHHRVNYALARRHNVSARQVSADRLIKRGDVLVNSTGDGTLGRVGLVREDPVEPTTVDTHVTIVRPQEGRFDPAFFGYMLIAIEPELAQGGEGASGQTELARKAIAERFLVTFPVSLLEQQRIVAILDEAFEGIAIATANARASASQAREYATAFLRDTLFESGATWHETTLGSEIRLQRGYDITKSQQREGSVPVVSSGGVKSYHDTFAAKAPGVVIGRKGSIGSLHFLDEDFWPHDTTLFVKNFGSNVPYFVYLFLKTLNLRSLDSGAANPALNRNLIHPIKVRWPDSREQQAIVRDYEHLDQLGTSLAAKYEAKFSALAALKQSLLHRAFTGQL